MATLPSGGKPALTKTVEPGASKTAPGKPAPDWERIELDYRAGIKTLRQIAGENGISHKALRYIDGITLDGVALEALKIVSGGESFHGNESTVVQGFLESHSVGLFDERLPQQSAMDTVVKEYALKYGRADIIMFHVDGTATVIEAKDGSKGYSHVVSGIGQCSLYAAQLMAHRGALKRVHKALLWSSAGDADVDAVIEMACESAGVIPLPCPSTEELVLVRKAVTKKELAHGRS